MGKETIFGIDICLKTENQLIGLIEQDIKNNRQVTIVSINPEKVMHAKRDYKFFDMITQATYRPVDGIGIKIASMINGGDVRGRVTGIDLFESLVNNARVNNRKVGLLGAGEGVAKLTKERLCQKLSGLEVNLVKNGFNDMYDNEILLGDINASKIDYLFVGLGSPKQEQWIFKNKDRLNVKVIQGVGGGIDIFSGNVKRAPNLIRKFGLEWLYRLLREPHRTKRQLKLFIFLFDVIKRKLSRKNNLENPYEYKDKN